MPTAAKQLVSLNNFTDPQEALIAFVRALAKRQARLDAGIPLVAANDNDPVVKH